MSGRALWKPKQLDSWDWKDAVLDERRPKPLPFEGWTRPDLRPGATDASQTGLRPGIEASQIVSWIGFACAGLAAMVFALSMIYGQLVSALTGFPTTPILPIDVLAASFVSGIVIGVGGLMIEARRSRDAETSSRSNEPGKSIAA